MIRTAAVHEMRPVAYAASFPTQGSLVFPLARLLVLAVLSWAAVGLLTLGVVTGLWPVTGAVTAVLAVLCAVTFLTGERRR